jgi:hypothetical protein
VTLYVEKPTLRVLKSNFKEAVERDSVALGIGN